MPTIKDFLNKYYQKIDNLDLELLISAAIKKPREFVLTHPEHKLKKSQISHLDLRRLLVDARLANLKSQILRRVKHEPLAYILGQKEFYGLEFKVDKNTLIPRPETEQIVENVLKLQPKNTTIIDVGTGSGNIIISLAKNLKGKNTFFATDISSKALIVARQNAKNHKLNKKINFLRGNLLEPIIKTTNHKLSRQGGTPPRRWQTTNYIIVANLPYLDNFWKNLDSCSIEIKYEPPIAFIGGIDGLDLYRNLARQIEKLITVNHISHVTCFFEIGPLQKSEMKKIFSFAKNIKFFKDLAGRFRIAKIEL